MPFHPGEYIQNKSRSCDIEAVLLSDSGEEVSHALRMQRGQSQADFLKNNSGSLHAFKKACGQSEQGIFVVGYGSQRQVSKRPVANTKSTSGLHAIQSLLGNHASMQDLDFIAQEFHNQGGHAGVRHLREFLNHFLPEELSCKGFSAASGKLRFHTTDGVESLEQLGNGWRQLLGWLGDFAFRAAQKFGFNTSPLTVKGILLIDEPDLHLHPLWQRQLLPILNRFLPNLQVIASSHAPLFVQQAGRDELYALYRDDVKAVKLLPFVGKPFRMLPHQLLMSPMFGLETDESLKVETEKAALRQAAMSSGKSGSREKSNAKASAALKEASAAHEAEGMKSNSINVRGNSHTEPEDLALLRQIQEALQEQIQGKSKK